MKSQDKYASNCTLKPRVLLFRAFHKEVLHYASTTICLKVNKSYSPHPLKKAKEKQKVTERLIEVIRAQKTIGVLP